MGGHSRLHSDVRTDNPWFDLAAHKIKQALYFADVLAGRDAHKNVYRMSVTNDPAKRVSWPAVDRLQRVYLMDFLEELDLWMDTLEAFWGLTIGADERRGIEAQIRGAL